MTNEEIKNHLYEWWKNKDNIIYCVKTQFKDECEFLGFEKKDGRRKHYNNLIYDIYDDYENKTTCEIYKTFRDEIFEIVLRREAGNYLIIGTGSERAFECDFRGVIAWDEELMLKLIKTFPSVFKRVFKIELGENNE